MYNELALYTLEHAKTDPTFIHQYVVDTFAAQYADEHTKPVKILFALVGLYLHIEKGYSGRAVQQAHMDLAKKHELDPTPWPTFTLPVDRGGMTIEDVMQAPAGPLRDQAILKWSRSVWAVYKEIHPLVERFVHKSLLYVV